MKSLIKSSLLILGVFCFALVFAKTVDSLRLRNDAAQYLSIASNIANSDGIKTDVLYYDQHFESKSVPANQTVWPPGYPYLVALVHIAGLSLDEAAAFVNGAGLVFVAMGIWFFMRELLVSRAMTGLAVFVWLSMAYTWAEAIGGMSSLSAIAASVFSMLFYIKSCRVDFDASRGYFYIGLAGLFAGISFGLHYSFAFYVIAVGLTFLGSNIANKRPAFWGHATTLLLSTAAIVVPVIWRNYTAAGVLTRTIDGDLDTSVYGIVYSLAGSIATIFGLGSDDYWLSALVGVSTIALAAILWISVIKSNQKSDLFDRLQLPTAFVLVAFFGFIVPAFFKGTWPINARYFTYMLPALFIVVFTILDRRDLSRSAMPRANRLAPWILIAIALSPQIVSFKNLIKDDATVNRNREIQALLEKDFGGESIRKFVVENINRESPIFANEPQATWLALQKPVLGVPPRDYSLTLWDEEAVLNLIRRFGVKYLLFFPEFIKPGDRSWSKHPFYDELATGKVPEWMHLEVSYEGIQLYSVAE